MSKSWVGPLSAFQFWGSRETAADQSLAIEAQPAKIYGTRTIKERSAQEFPNQTSNSTFEGAACLRAIYTMMRVDGHGMAGQTSRGAEALPQISQSPLRAFASLLLAFSSPFSREIN